MYENEIWRDIAGYNGKYQVSNLGRVRSLHKGKPHILKPKFSGGYPQVSLSHNGKRVTCYVHRLVALAFVENPESKPEVDHVNCDKTDNRAENLRWATTAENKRYALELGLAPQGEANYNAKLTNAQAKFIRENPDGLTTKQLAEMFDVREATIRYVQLGKRYKNAGGSVREKIDRRIPDEIREKIRAEYIPGKYGHGSHVLAKKYGTDSTTVLKIIREV